LKVKLLLDFLAEFVSVSFVFVAGMGWVVARFIGKGIKPKGESKVNM
jgi:hypothetical protein